MSGINHDCPEHISMMLENIEKIITEDKNNRSLYTKAIEEYSRLLARSPFDYLIYRYRGHRYLSLSKYNQAAADLELACRINPFYWKSWYYLGMISYYNIEYQQALYYFNQSLNFIGKDTNYISAIVNWTFLCLCHLDQKEQAQKLLNPFTKNGDEGHQVYPNLILLHNGQKTSSEIEAIFNSGELSDTSYISFGFGLAKFYYFNNEKEKAKHILVKLLNEGKAWYALAYKACESDIKLFYNNN